MIFFIENIRIELTENIHGLTLTTSSGELPLPGQNILETTEILQSNFKIVQKHFIKMITAKEVMVNDILLPIGRSYKESVELIKL